MYKRKSSGPKIDPWGTPLLIILLSDIVLLTTQHCVLFWRYDFNIPMALSQIPYRLSFRNRIEWSTESNALLRSTNRTPFRLPQSIFLYHCSVALISAVRVEWFDLNPDWNLVMILLFVK